MAKREELKDQRSIIMEEPSFEQIEIVGKNEGKDEVDELETETPEGKKKKSGLLGRLSTRKKKSRKNSKEETQVSEGRDKTDQNEEVKNIKETEETRQQAKCDAKTACRYVGQEKTENDDRRNEEAEVCTTENSDGKENKSNHRHTLFLSKATKSNTKEKKENSKVIEKDFNPGSKEIETDLLKPEEKTDGENVYSTNPENHEACKQPETVVQSEDGKTTHQPITVDLQGDQEQQVEKDDKELCSNISQHESHSVEHDETEDDKSMDQSIFIDVEGDKEHAPEKERKELCKNVNKDENTAVESIGTIISLPSDIAQKAVQTFRQVLKPVFIYLIKKHPHCFKDMMESKKYNACQ